jgi:hypothetical protein
MQHFRIQELVIYWSCLRYPRRGFSSLLEVSIAINHTTVTNLPSEDNNTLYTARKRPLKIVDLLSYTKSYRRFIYCRQTKWNRNVLCLFPSESVLELLFSYKTVMPRNRTLLFLDYKLLQMAFNCVGCLRFSDVRGRLCLVNVKG